MKRPKREENSRTKLAGKSCDRAKDKGNKSPVEGGEKEEHAAESNARVKKVPKTGGKVWERESSSQRDSTTSSSCSSASSVRRPGLNLPPSSSGLHLHHSASASSALLPLHSASSTASLCATPASTDLLPFHHHQFSTSPLGSSSSSAPFPLSSLQYGPFGIPQLFHPPPSASSFHPPPLPSASSFHPPPPLPSIPLTSSTALVAPQNLFEGLPIFVVPQTGSLSLNAIQRASEFKAMALNVLLQQQQQQNQQKNAKVDTSKHFYIFVGDLSQEVDNLMLKEAFQKFGEVSEAKVMRDSQSSKSRSFGFVAYPNKEDAQRAIEEMNGFVLGRRPVRTGWAVRRSSVGAAAQQNGSEDEGGNNQQQPPVTSFESVYNSTDADNTTVYLGGLPNSATEEPIRSAFSQFGIVREIRLFAAQNFGFVVFADKASATRSIVEMHGRELDLGVVAGQCVLKVKWGRQPQQQQEKNVAGGGSERTGGTQNGTFGSPVPALLASISAQQQSAALTAVLAQQQQQQLALCALVQFHQQQQQQFPAPVPASTPAPFHNSQQFVPGHSVPGSSTGPTFCAMAFPWTANQ